MSRFDVIGVGVSAFDYLTRVDDFPGVDTKVRSEVLEMQGGGTVGTALATVSRLGLRAAFAGILGDDDFGRGILSGLEADEVDTSLTVVAAGARSPFAFCVSSPPHRTVFSIRPTTPPLAISDAALDAYLDARYLHLDGTEEQASVQLARAARVRGVGVSLDFQRVRPDSDELLALADVAIVSEAFARERFGDVAPPVALQALHRPSMQLAAITLGARGSIGTDGKTTWEIPAEPVEVVDSTGAGDVYHGAALVALLHGHDVAHALRFATHVAGLSCRALGGRAGIPTRDELGGEWL